MKLIISSIVTLLISITFADAIIAQGVGPIQPQPLSAPAGARYARAVLDPSVRIKDITFVDGDRNNHVSGDGLVFGLSGTGGKSEQTRSMATSYFLNKGIRVGRVETTNLSAVLVSGKIPP